MLLGRIRLISQSLIDDSKRAHILAGQRFLRTTRVQGVLEMNGVCGVVVTPLQMLDGVWWVTLIGLNSRLATRHLLSSLVFYNPLAF